jgi:hypothetical protein
MTNVHILFMERKRQANNLTSDGKAQSEVVGRVFFNSKASVFSFWMKGEGFKGTGDDYTRKQQAREERMEVLVTVFGPQLQALRFFIRNSDSKI